MALRVIVDTHVLVTGLIGGKGPNREVPRHCLQGDLQPFVGNALYVEYQDLLNRENIQALCKQTAISLMEFLDGFAKAAYIITNNVPDFAQAELKRLGFEVITPEQLAGTKIMTTLSIRLPDDMAQRLKKIAQARDISLNKLIFELSAQTLAEESKQRFMAVQCGEIPNAHCGFWTNWRL